jgi:hypothetical protein
MEFVSCVSGSEATRGDDAKQEAVFSYVSSVKRVPPEGPLRAIRARAGAVLAELMPRFVKRHADVGERASF